jgi:glycosyltransferase involved in cell wall biosynthesis
MGRIIAVMPAYNEEKRIASVISKTKEYVDEIVVVDDGSSDNTSNVSKEANFILKHAINMGKGLALKTGIEFALKRNPELIITIDADGQHEPSEIPKLINQIKEHKADLVIGSRTKPDNMPLLYRYGNFFIHSTFRLLFQNIKDTQSGFRIFNPDINEKIKWQASDYKVEAEVLANANKHNLKCIEVPINTIYQDHYKGTTVIDGVKIVFNMLKWRFLRW